MFSGRVVPDEIEDAVVFLRRNMDTLVAHTSYNISRKKDSTQNILLTNIVREKDKSCISFQKDLKCRFSSGCVHKAT